MESNLGNESCYLKSVLTFKHYLQFAKIKDFFNLSLVCKDSESVSRSFRQKEDNFKISFIHLLYIHSYIQTKFFKKIISECSSDKLINSKKICIGFLHSSEKLVSLNEKILYWSEKLKPLNSKTFKALKGFCLFCKENF